MDSSNSSEITVIGAACVDYFCEVKDFPKRGETITATNYFDAAGGKGANQAVAVARLLGDSIFSGQIGDDDAGRRIESDMKITGVNMGFIRKLKGVRSAAGYITITESGENTIITVSGASFAYQDLTKLPQEYLDAIDNSISKNIVLLQREIPNEINTLICKYAKSKGKLVGMDVGGKDDPFNDDLLSNIDFLSPNEVNFVTEFQMKTELERIIGMPFGEKIEETIRNNLLNKYPNMKILLKLGAHGSAIVTKDHYIKVKSVTAYNEEILKDYKIIDVTGAGDCFTGAFFVRYSQLKGKVDEEKLYEKCMLFANACAFLCITERGCIPAMPEFKNVEAFVNKYLKSLEIL